MRKTFIFVFLSIIALSVSAKGEFTSHEWEKLKKGEVLVTEVPGQNPDGSQRVEFLGKVYVKAKKDVAWKYLRDYDKFPEFMPNLTICKTLKKEGETFYVHYETKVLMVKAKYDMILTGEPLKKITFKLDKTKPSDIRDASGYWIIEDAPDGSGIVLSYSTFIDTGIPAPEALARSATKKSLPGVLNNMRNRIESNGTWKKPQGT